MSILIKGMDMPKDGCHHTITIYADGSVACGMRNNYISIEIPKHGRLIDADAIEYESIDSSDTARHESYYGLGILAVRKEDVDNVSTIIEAEE